MNFIDDLKSKYAQQTALGQLIVVIVALTLVSWLLQYVYAPSYYWFRLPPGLWETLLQPWSIITYAFLHSGIFHLFWNMLILFSFGQMMLNFFNSRQLITLFFAGVLSGSAFYLLGESLFSTYVNSAGLVGASAGVYAVALFVCSYQPDTEVRLIFFNLKLKYIGYFLLVMTIAGIFARDNVGGNLAHLGGIAIGFYTAHKMRDGIDILKGLSSVGDWFQSMFKSTPKKEKKAPMKTVYRNKKSTNSTAKEKSTQQKKIDAILDKISASGYESLSKAEKDFLFKAGKD
ncbi:rhomboid family intramembrane serine protease [Nonlabens ulvanivorans]|uniref:rhomboid family intramembrane serine protease n=1 Tax=Nonlabens ulvanivorans TaxID=906888 RepID=UPI0037CBB8CF